MSYTPPKRKSISKKQRQTVYEKYSGHCAYCGCELLIRDMQVDHLIPMELYEVYKVIGQDIDTIENYMPACRSCNHYKSSMTLEKFRTAIERFTEVLMRDNSTYKNAVRFGQVIPNKHKVVFYFEKLEMNQNKESENG